MQASPAEHRSYRSQVPGARVLVDLPLALIDRIAAEAIDGLQLTGRGSEIGGLLLGRTRRDGSQTIVEIHDVEPVECEHAAGPSLMLSAADRRSLEGQLKRRKGGVVGFYRSNTRREFTGTMEDAALMSWYFPQRSNVFLIVQAGRDEPLRGAFLAWDGRVLGGKVEEFPFSRAALAGRSYEAADRVAAAPGWSAGLRGGWAAAAVIAIGLVAGATFERLKPGAPEVVSPATSRRVVGSTASQPTVSVPTEEPASLAQQPATAAVEAPTLAPALVDAPAEVEPQAPAAEPMKSADRRSTEFVPPPRLPVREPTTADPPAVDRPQPTTVPTLAFPMSAPPPAPPARSPEPAPESRIRVAVDAVSRTRAGKFVPPTAVREERPVVPATLARQISREVSIEVKVYVDRAGKVEYAELLSNAARDNRELASLAVFASRRWQFAPAQRDGKPMPGEAVLRFRFQPDAP
jgi:TonB family protein